MSLAPVGASEVGTDGMGWSVLREWWEAPVDPSEVLSWPEVEVWGIPPPSERVSALGPTLPDGHLGAQYVDGATVARPRLTLVPSSRRGGRAIGGVLVRRLRARGPRRCGCCPSCVIGHSDVVYEVALGDGAAIVACATCAGAS